MRFSEMCVRRLLHYPRKLPGDDADLCGRAELREELLASFPRQAQGPYVGDADSRHSREWSGDELDRIRRPSLPNLPRLLGCPAIAYVAGERQAFQQRS